MSEQRPWWKAVLWGFGTWLLHCLAALTVVIFLATCIPSIIRIFEELDAELPSATILTIHLSDFAVSYWYLIAFPLMIDFPLLIGLSLAPPKVRWMVHVWSWLALATAFMLIIFAAFTVSAPLDRLQLPAGFDEAAAPETSPLGSDAGRPAPDEEP